MNTREMYTEEEIAEMQEYHQQIEQETKEYVEKINNAIKTVREAHVNCFKNLHPSLSILFYNNGKDFTFGIDSCYTLQIQLNTLNAINKNQIIQSLKGRLEMI